MVQENKMTDQLLYLLHKFKFFKKQRNPQRHVSFCIFQCAPSQAQPKVSQAVNPASCDSYWDFCGVSLANESTDWYGLRPPGSSTKNILAEPRNRACNRCVLLWPWKIKKKPTRQGSRRVPRGQHLVVLKTLDNECKACFWKPKRKLSLLALSDTRAKTKVKGLGQRTPDIMRVQESATL